MEQNNQFGYSAQSHERAQTPIRIGDSVSALVITQCNHDCQCIPAPVSLTDLINSCPGTALNAA